MEKWLTSQLSGGCSGATAFQRWICRRRLTLNSIPADLEYIAGAADRLLSARSGRSRCVV